MPTSQNGYSANDRAVIHSATIAGTDVKVAVRTGPAGDLLLYAAARWHHEVEPLRAPDGVLDCWGYAERNIRGSATTLSNHASGTALDLRARAHPLGTAAIKTFTTEQIRAVRRIIADCGGALRWGGDYSGRPDPMHVEVDAPAQRCAQVLLLLTATGGGATTSSDLRKGDRSPEVFRLQTILTTRYPAYAHWSPVTDYFGDQTDAAVREFQRRSGLVADGIVGPLTRKALGL